MARPPARRKSSKSSEAVTSNEPPAWICPVTLAFATVSSLGLMTTTITEPSTAAFDVDTPTSTANEWNFSVDVADTVIEPSASTTLFWQIVA